MRLNSREKIVWVYHEDHGLRIVDRRWQINQNLSGKVWVVNPYKWSVAPIGLLDLSRKYGFEVARGSIAEIGQLLSQYEERIEVLCSEATKQAHILHLKAQSIEVPFRSTKIHSGRPRATHCWSCKSQLNSEMDMACVICGWLLCECGTCGCGR
jgi:hypothetical protein